MDFKFKVFRNLHQSIIDLWKLWRGIVDTPKRQTSRQLCSLSEWCLNLSTFLKDKSQTGWRHVHSWWTNQWLGPHWSSEI